MIPDADLLILDDIVPSLFSPFRTLEYQHYLERYGAALMSTAVWRPLGWAPDLDVQTAAMSFPVADEARARITAFDDAATVSARLAYVTFFTNAVRFLPWLERMKLPLVLQLYPGGGLELDRPSADASLQRVLDYRLLRRIITTQSVIRDYLVERMRVDEALIEFVYGGVFALRGQAGENDKLRYPDSKHTLDVCFVAHRYGGDLVSKGYGDFVAIATQLARRVQAPLRFHVVGGYGPQDVELGSTRNSFTFYGIQDTAFFEEFYRSMDCIVSLSHPFTRAPGNFDGFPTGACVEAALAGVLNCVSDPLRLNPGFVDGVDLVLLPDDPFAAADRLVTLLAVPAELYRLAERNERAYRKVFDLSVQLGRRDRVIDQELSR